MVRKISIEGLEQLKSVEKLKLLSYRDSRGVLTIGYGHTSMMGTPIVHENMQITPQEAEHILQKDIEFYENLINENVKVPLNDSQFAALVSFAFNIGNYAFLHSTLLKKLNQGDYEAVPSELLRWVYCDKEKLSGLVKRRMCEIVLWNRIKDLSYQTLSAEYSLKELEEKTNFSHESMELLQKVKPCIEQLIDGFEKVSEEDNRHITKNTAPKINKKAATFTGMSMLGMACSDTAHQMAPHVNEFPILMSVFIILTLIGVGFIIFKFYRHFFK